MLCVLLQARSRAGSYEGHGVVPQHAESHCEGQADQPSDVYWGAMSSINDIHILLHLFHTPSYLIPTATYIIIIASVYW